MVMNQPNPDLENRDDLQVQTESPIPVSEELAERQETFQTAQQLQHKPVVDVKNGARLGEVSDLLFDPESLQIGALMVTSGGIFNRENQTIPAGQVTVWGKDYILVDPTRSTVQEPDGLLKLSDQLRGRYVVSVNGTRIGQIDDVEIDEHGHIMGYRLSQVFVEGPLQKSRWIPASATHSLGKDVLIVNENQIS